VMRPTTPPGSRPRTNAPCPVSFHAPVPASIPRRKRTHSATLAAVHIIAEFLFFNRKCRTGAPPGVGTYSPPLRAHDQGHRSVGIRQPTAPTNTFLPAKARPRSRRAQIGPGSLIESVAGALNSRPVTSSRPPNHCAIRWTVFGPPGLMDGLSSPPAADSLPRFHRCKARWGQRFPGPNCITPRSSLQRSSPCNAKPARPFKRATRFAKKKNGMSPPTFLPAFSPPCAGVQAAAGQPDRLSDMPWQRLAARRRTIATIRPESRRFGS